MIKITDLTPEFILEHLPFLSDIIEHEIRDPSSCPELPYVFYPDTIGQELYHTILSNGSENKILEIFKFYELLAANGNDDVKTFLEVALLEELWDNEKTFEEAKKYMYTKTRELFEQIHVYLNILKA
jgi:hypothetical protein